MFKLFSNLIFFGSGSKLSFDLTLASRELFIVIPTELEYPLVGLPNKAFSKRVYSAVFPSASII